MGLKKAEGNMYSWCTHTHTHLGGVCPHRCVYCYVDNPRFGRPPRYQGELRLVEWEFKVKYDKQTLTLNRGVYPGVIFIEHMNDLFADDVPRGFIHRVLQHCQDFPDNTYVFQTKNPARYVTIGDITSTNYLTWPKYYMMGTTIETNRPMSTISRAPPTNERAAAMALLKGRKFLTIEPILQFDLDELLYMIVPIKPEFINIGADSKKKGLLEPTWDEVRALILGLTNAGIIVREKHNLERLKR